MWAYVFDPDFLQFLASRNLKNSPETFQLFLKEVGTTDLKWTKQQRDQVAPSCVSQYVRVPPGSCIRLRTPDAYARVVAPQLTREKQDKSRRSSSCTIV
jgi:hypothetical protein